jgi:4-hydroxy-tetrahydrodipicolinate reductase
MGRMIAARAAQDAAFRVVGLVEHAGHPAVGMHLEGTDPDARIVDDLDAALAVQNGVDVVLEFAHASATEATARAATAARVALLVGTTGHGPETLAALDRASTKIPVLAAPNTSVGVTALLEHLTPLARSLAGFDVRISETHHRAKKDAPSGTALALGRALSETSAVEYSSVRAGTIAGIHTILFAGAGEHIELTHVAESRECFAAGALRAAAWLRGRAPGRYSMRDVLSPDAELEKETR